MPLNDSLYRELPWKDAEVAGREAIASSLVMLANKKSALPLSDLSNLKAASLSISLNRRSGFTSGIDHYITASHFSLSPQATTEAFAAMKKTLAPFTTLIVAVYADPRLSLRAKEINELLHTLEAGKRLIVVHFGPAEDLALLDRYPLMIHSFGTEAISQSFAAQAIFGGVPLPARLPMTCSQVFCYGDGCPVKKQTRVKYGIPEEVGISSNVTARMDSLIHLAINAGAFPGCQVFVACKGQVIVNKGWGYHTYKHEEEVHTGDLYDLASVTKVAASTIAMMTLYDAGRIKLDTTLNYYFKDLDKNSHNKKVRDSKLNYITLRQLMTHCSGLPAALPIARFISPRWYLKYMLELERKRMTEESNDTLVAEEQSPEWMIDTSQLMMDEDSIFNWMFVHEKDNAHKLQIGEDFFMRAEVVDSIWQLSKQTGVRKNKSYLYSDMNFYLVMKVVEVVAKMSIDKYMTEKIYRPMNLGRICYNPRKNFKKEQIVPTEDEKIFRKQLLEGFVHDPTAALLGGVSGNAGLFSNAENLGILMQMLLNLSLIHI
jgi:CubicO group peptidase (beta-lactamase class C family)